MALVLALSSRPPAHQHQLSVTAGARQGPCLPWSWALAPVPRSKQPGEQVASGHAEPGQRGHQSDGFVAQELGVTPLSPGSPATQQPHRLPVASDGGQIWTVAS